MKLKNSIFKAIAVLAVAAGALAIAQPANATTSNTTGSQGTNYVVYWETARNDTYDANYDQFKLTSATTLGGGYFTMAFRTSGGTSYARTGSISQLNKWYVVKADNGKSYLPPRTFYTNTEITGACGGSGCGTINWSGSISYNVQLT